MKIASDNPEVTIVAPIGQEQKTAKFGLIDRQRIPKGHSLFAINMVTCEIEQVTYLKQTLDLRTDNPELRKKVITKPGFFYTPALNKQQAIEHWLKKLFPTSSQKQRKQSAAVILKKQKDSSSATLSDQ